MGGWVLFIISSVIQIKYINPPLQIRYLIKIGTFIMSMNSRRLLSVTLIASLCVNSSIYLKIDPAIAIGISQNSEDKSKADQLIEQGNILFRSGKYQDAIFKFEQALIIYKSIGDQAKEGKTQNNLGLVYENLGQYQKAIYHYQQSLVIFKRIGDRNGEGNAFDNLGAVYKILAQYQKSIDYHQQALAIFRIIRDHNGEGITLKNLGSVYLHLGQYEKAIDYYYQALIIINEVENQGEGAAILNNIGLAYVYLREYQIAINFYQEALAISQKIGDRNGEGIILGGLGAVNKILKQYQKAINYSERALVIKREKNDRNGEGMILNNLGAIYNDLKQYQKAINHYQQALFISNEIGDHEGAGITLNNLGHSFYEMRRLPAAESVLSQAIEIWESLRDGLTDANKISFGDKVGDTYQLLQKVLIEQNKIEFALEISERARARALVELLTSKVKTISSESAINKIRIAPNLAKIQQIAKQKNATLVQYSIVNDTIYIWVIQPNGKVTFKPSKIPPQTKLQDLVIATRDSIGANRGRRNKDNDKTTPQVKLQQLHQLLIAPIAAYLPKEPTASVVILPQGELFSVPFAALQDAQGKYLIESHTLTIAPSIQVLGLTQSKSANRQGKPLIVGNPIMPLYKGEPLSNLIGAEKEAQAIGEILRVQPLIGKAADKQQVIARMRQASLIHFATHGFFERVGGDLPGAIALTNGFLTSDEIFDLNLPADLVVLSACDTGRGDLTGDGVIGLSRSLVVAGVPSVIVSLWEVRDRKSVV